MSSLSMSNPSLSGYKEHIKLNEFSVEFGSILTVRSWVKNNTDAQIDDVVLIAHSDSITQSSALSIAPNASVLLTLSVPKRVYERGNFDVYARSSSNPSIIVDAPKTFYITEYTKPTPPTPTDFTLHIAVKGEGNVFKSPSLSTYKKDTIVDLTHQASDGWELDPTKTSQEILQGKVLMNKNKALYACFTKEELPSNPNPPVEKPKYAETSVPLSPYDPKKVLEKLCPNVENEPNEVKKSVMKIQAYLHFMGFEIGCYWGSNTPRIDGKYLDAQCCDNQKIEAPLFRILNEKLGGKYIEEGQPCIYTYQYANGERVAPVAPVDGKPIIMIKKYHNEIREFIELLVREGYHIDNLFEYTWLFPVHPSHSITSDEQFLRDRPKYKHNDFKKAVNNSMHKGIDIGAAKDKPIRPMMEGVIKQFNELYYSAGYIITIEHEYYGKTIYSRYYHLNRVNPNLRVGDRVNTNNIIGFVGGSGTGGNKKAYPSHLHFQVQNVWNIDTTGKINQNPPTMFLRDLLHPTQLPYKRLGWSPTDRYRRNPSNYFVGAEMDPYNRSSILPDFSDQDLLDHGSGDCGNTGGPGDDVITLPVDPPKDFEIM